MADYSQTDPYGNANHYSNSMDEPPEPDNIPGVKRGTQEWRDAFNKRREWKAQVVLSQGGAGNPRKAAEILAKLTRDTATETGDELRKKIAHNQYIGDEVSRNAESLRQQGNDRQWWAGGAGGRALTQEEMDQITSGGYGSATGGRATPETIARWQAGMKAGNSPTENNGPDLWPGNNGMEGSLPQYNAQQFQPGNDAWGGWGGVYGNNPTSTSPMPAASNPAGLTQPQLVPPAAYSSMQPGHNPNAPLGSGLYDPGRSAAQPRQPGLMGGPVGYGGSSGGSSGVNLPPGMTRVSHPGSMVNSGHRMIPKPQEGPIQPNVHQMPSSPMGPMGNPGGIDPRSTGGVRVPGLEGPSRGPEMGRQPSGFGGNPHANSMLIRRGR